MTEEMLISAQKLATLVAEDKAQVFDCRFNLHHPDQGRHSWLAAHIPRAMYAHLGDNLSGRITTQSGRHPLPAARSFAAFLARSGWLPGKRVVAYDAHGGAFASRLWWLMNYFGLGSTSLLDGGINAWMASGLTMESGPVSVKRTALPALTPHPGMILNTQAVINGLENDEIQLLDARAQDRFNGTSEPIDPVAGHVPGAANHPMDQNVAEGSFFRNEAELKSQFRRVIGKRDPAEIIHMCGSGVTACHNQFAMELAGILGSRLYVGSWSEWIRNPLRPVATGDK